MKLKESYIYLRSLRFHALHGVAAQEHVVGNDYVVDLRLRVDVSAAMQSDDVTDTVNYAEVYRLVARVMAEPRQLLEYVAGHMADAILSAWPQVTEVMVGLTKCNPPMGADCAGAGVEISVVR